MCKVEINSIEGVVILKLQLDTLLFESTGHLRTEDCVNTSNEVLFVELWLFVCFVFRLAATKGIRISRRDYLKVNVRRTWSEKCFSFKISPDQSG